ncbi:hypothetical protein [Streptomyces sp. NBC_00212]|uniref:hypothetical protein n=1 Tax=Streptomyces sp. NBC_00212 TaxID=2975684 RepID=UPI003245A70D
MRRAARGFAARLAVVVVLALGVVLPAAPTASACSIGVGYKPSVSMKDLRQHRACSAATSATGAVAVAVLALGALSAAGALVVRRAERQMSDRQAEDLTIGPAPVLTEYLAATGIVPPVGEHTHAP